MKKLVICIFMMLCLGVNNSNSQTIERQGKVFTVKGKGIHKADTLVTEYKYEISGIQYPIIINKDTGACYIWKKSKNGNLYKQYLKPEVSKTVCKELGIEYKPKNRK